MPDEIAPQPSIQRRLLQLLAVVMLIVVACAAAVSYFLALSVAQSAYDRSLLDPAFDIANNIRVGPSGAELDMLTQAQEVCDRIGILANGRLVCEGRLDELVAIENQTELVLQNASEDLLRRIDSLTRESNAQVIEQRGSTTTLERLFLEATKNEDYPPNSPNDAERRSI